MEEANVLSPTACPKDGRGLLKERGGKGVQCWRGGLEGFIVYSC